MQVDELANVSVNLDYSQVPPIQQKRIIAFVNHFVTNTVSYLNNFCQTCESRFLEFEYKIQRVEASLLILEAQLSSIPEFDKQHQVENGEKIDVSAKKEILVPSVEVTNQVENHNAQPDATIPSEKPDPNAVEIKGVKASEHPKFVKYFKMVRVGVHEQAVRLKMQSEGCDPNILDNPDAVIPNIDE